MAPGLRWRAASRVCATTGGADDLKALGLALPQTLAETGQPLSLEKRSAFLLHLSFHLREAGSDFSDAQFGIALQRALWRLIQSSPGRVLAPQNP
jgi:hypothetical protein